MAWLFEFVHLFVFGVQVKNISVVLYFGIRSKDGGGLLKKRLNAAEVLLKNC